jgi:hypothetical protein
MRFCGLRHLSQCCIQNFQANIGDWTHAARKCLRICYKIFASKPDSSHHLKNHQDTATSGALGADEASESFSEPFHSIVMQDGRALEEFGQCGHDPKMAMNHLKDVQICSLVASNMAQACKLPLIYLSLLVCCIVFASSVHAYLSHCRVVNDNFSFSPKISPTSN